MMRKTKMFWIVIQMQLKCIVITLQVGLQSSIYFRFGWTWVFNSEVFKYFTH